MQKIVILGAGMVGGAMAADLSEDFSVLVADIDAARLETLKKRYRIETMKTDLSKPAQVGAAVKEADLVIGAVPGFMGFRTLETVIKNKKNSVDISFFAEDPFELDALALEQDVTAVMDCGVAPGMSNMMLGHYNEIMEIDRFTCLVGGLPVIRSWPYEYKAPFSPIDVIEEYLRPARIVENGRLVVKPALSEPEPVEFEGVGTLEAFNTDGLRTVIKTMSTIPNMIEKTLRYPGHIEKMRMLRETGFLSDEPVDVGGHMIAPVDLTTRLLFPLWKLGDEEEEFTAMRITITGKKNGAPHTVTAGLLDRYDPKTGMSSMARTTGYPCTGTARLILAGDYQRKGISPPEYVGAVPGCLEKILTYLQARNIVYHIHQS
ncbi:saccharopine dehydrogenase NADP-binding domain-containing protein [bacterium]|nr:saccharopine dehydrogenase NADP-binding domain-containing protein [bacterium]